MPLPAQIEALMRALPCLDFPDRETIRAGEIQQRLGVSKNHLLKLLSADKAEMLRLGKEESSSAIRLTLSSYRAWIIARLVKGSGLPPEELLKHPFLTTEFPSLPAELLPGGKAKALTIKEAHTLLGVSASELCNDADEGHLPLLDLALVVQRRWLRLPRSIYRRYVAHGFARGKAYAARPTTYHDPRQQHIFETIHTDE